MKKEFICSDCKDPEKKHMAKGLCSTCYMRHRNAEKARENEKCDIEPQQEPVMQVNEKCQSRALSLTVEFAGEDVHLYHAIIANAKHNRRSVSNEVLFMLDQLTPRKEEPKKIVPIAVGGKYF